MTTAGGAYGNGTVFLLVPSTGHEVLLHSFAGGTDGADPLGDLIDVEDTLYGTTDSGGAYEYGTAFKLKL